MKLLALNVPLPPAADMAAFAPELIVTATAVAVLLLPFFLTRSRRDRLTAAVTALGAAAAAVAAGAFFVRGGSHPAFSGLLVADRLSSFLRVLIFGFLALIAVMWLITASRRRNDATVIDAPEFFTLLIAATVGMGMMVSSVNLLMVVVGIELASLPSYAMAGFQKQQRLGAEAAMKYVVFGAVTAAVMLYGVSLLYGVYGTLSVDRIAASVASAGTIPPVAVIGMLGLLAGVGFKISAVPFHFWCPDVFEGASVEVATFLSVASKAAGLALLLRLVYAVGGFAGAAPHYAGSIALAVGILATLTATLGNLAALAQDNLKRMLAYSSIAHAGYVLMAVAILPTDGQGISGSPGAQALVLYLLVYLFMNLGAFSVVALVYNRTGSERIEAFAGLGRRAPLLAIPMALFLVSLVGLPPMAGFAAKFQLFYALFVYQPISLRWLVVVGLVNTLISLFYYMRVVRAMFLQTTDDGPIEVSALAAGWVIAMAVPVTGLLVVWQPLTKLF
ncbi:MAG: NADH-quinone oxidoreductase subunit N [Phycisphaerae bacterium]|nr:NADH-quinone oxidoreductase subunit N [Phycisphaerae bacterium]